MIEQRSIFKQELLQKRNDATKSLQDYKVNQQKNYQDYISQTSEQQYINDFESLSKPSIKSMPVRTKDLLNKYKAQLEEFQPKYQVIPKGQIADPQSHIQSITSQQSEQKNPFEQSKNTQIAQQDMSFNKQQIEHKESEIMEEIQEDQKNPFESSSVMQYTQTQQLLDPYMKTNSEKNQYTSQESSNLQNYSQTQEKSLDSQQFYENVEQIDQLEQSNKISIGTQHQKYDHNYQQSSRTYNSIKEEIQDESSNLTHSSEKEDNKYLQSNQSPIYESIDQSSQLVETTQRWSQYQTIPQTTAQFNPTQPIPESKQEYNNSQITKQGSQQTEDLQQQQSYMQNQSKEIQPIISQLPTNTQIIFKKLSQELVIDIDKFENSSKLLKSINKTQLLYISEQYLELVIQNTNKQLLNDFRMLKKILIFQKTQNEKIQKQILIQLKINKIYQLEKLEKNRKARQYFYQNQQQLSYNVLNQLKIYAKHSKDLLFQGKNKIKFYKLQIMLNKWKEYTYNNKMKKQMKLQYKYFIFNGWLKITTDEKKRKEIKALQHFYYFKLNKYYKFWKQFTIFQVKLHQKYIDACIQIKKTKKYQMLQKWQKFVEKMKKNREFELLAKEANEYIPINVKIGQKNIKIYNFS